MVSPDVIQLKTTQSKIWELMDREMEVNAFNVSSSRYHTLFPTIDEYLLCRPFCHEAKEFHRAARDYFIYSKLSFVQIDIWIPANLFVNLTKTPNIRTK